MGLAGDVIENPAGLMRMRVLRGGAETNGELLELEATYEPGSIEPLVHFHPRQDEHFEVVSGSIRAHVGRDERVLGAGEVLDVPAGVVHAMWNDGDGEAKVIWQTRPALRSEDFFRKLGALAQQHKLTSKGPRNPLLGASLLYRFRDEFRLANLPRLVQMIGLPPLAGLARLFGQDV
jgi:mannose-6-phosphate isomerase-like protein (cupin superfamily)